MILNYFIADFTELGPFGFVIITTFVSFFSYDAVVSTVAVVSIN